MMREVLPWYSPFLRHGKLAWSHPRNLLSLPLDLSLALCLCLTLLTYTALLLYVLSVAGRLWLVGFVMGYVLCACWRRCDWRDIASEWFMSVCLTGCILFLLAVMSYMPVAVTGVLFLSYHYQPLLLPVAVTLLLLDRRARR